MDATDLENTADRLESTPVDSPVLLHYQAHVEGKGWLDEAHNGSVCGTTGQSRRLEAFKIRVESPDLEGGVSYCAHVQDIGWQPVFGDNETAGTTGQSKRVEAIRIELTGKLKEHYDVLYKVHLEGSGWSGWHSNGETAGTTGQSRRLEAFIAAVNKKGQPRP